MTLVVRDERDIVESNLRYHIAQGVERFVAIDNGSTDGTLEVLRRYSDAGLVHLIEGPPGDYHRMQPGWFTHLARLAATELEADWVIVGDADEFWWPVEGRLDEMLAAVPEPYGTVIAPRLEFVARPDGSGSFSERLVIREARSRVKPKMAHRAHPKIEISRGAHRLLVRAQPAGGRTASSCGRAVFRVAGAQAEGDRPVLAPAPMWPARILHFPLRSYAQFRRKVELSLNEGAGARRRALRRDYEQGRLPALYAEMIPGDEEIEAGLRRGSLVVDHGLRDVLAACPDPLAGARRPAPARRPDRERVRAELAAIRVDAMHALARDQADAQRRIDRLEDSRRRLRSRKTKLRRRLSARKAELALLRRRLRRLRRERDRLAAGAEPTRLPAVGLATRVLARWRQPPSPNRSPSRG